MTKTSLIPLLALAMVSAPAFATDVKNGANANGTVDSSQSSKPASAQRYCVQGVTTGTILPSRECRTRAEWLKRGVDPLKPNG